MGRRVAESHARRDGGRRRRDGGGCNRVADTAPAALDSSFLRVPLFTNTHIPGADPHVVRAHLQTLDSHVDDAYFAHLWPLLARHPCTQVVIAADALPDANGVIPEGVPLTDELQNDLFRVLEADDGGDPPIKTSDLAALLQRYPARVRLRCTEDEIYYRLTGSRKRVSSSFRPQS